MNKQLYRVVFSKKFGVYTAVAENAPARGKGTSAAVTPANASTFSALSHTIGACFKSLALTLALLFGGIHIVSAQIVADPNAAGNKRPLIDNTANGLPLVQITTPNNAGVSHNRYNNFSPDKQGVILNNARNDASTQLGGWISGNPNLSSGSARLILNEVTSLNPSHLRGYVEVGGQRADVVISNPNGIFLEGTGFINASRGVYTTGTPVFGGNGSLDAFRVTQGQIQINGAGLNDTATAQIDLIARSVQVNTKMWADRLNVITGANKVNYADLGVQIIPGEGGVPTVAVDVGNLGGMYTNKILMIGTEAGVGVRSYGDMIALGSDFSIDSKSRVTLAGNTGAKGNLSVAGTSIDMSGVTTQAGGNFSVTAIAGDIDNHNAITTAGGSMDLRATGAFNNTGGRASSGSWLSLLATSLDNSNGKIETVSNSTGNLTVTSTNAITNTNGNVSSARNLGLRASTLIGNGQARAGLDLAIVLAGDYIQTAANTFSATGNLSFLTTGTLTNYGTFAGSNTTVNAANIINQAGGLFNSNGLTALAVTNSLINNSRIYGNDIALGGISITNNANAVIAARSTANIGAQTIVSREHALIKSEGGMAFGGALDANNKATGTAASITNSSATIDSGGNLAFATQNLNNINAHFATAVQQDPSKTRNVVEYELAGVVYTPDQAEIISNDGLQKLLIKATGNRQNDYTIRRYTETTQYTVVTQTDPAKILAFGNMTLSGNVTNDKSAIVAGGTLGGQTGDINNIDVKGESTVHRQGTSTYHSTKSSFTGGRRDTWSDSDINYDLPTTHFDMNLWQAKANTAPISGSNPAQGQLVKPISYVPGSVTPLFGLPDNALYQIAIAPSSPYLVATDPAYTNYRNFLSSDYLLGRLSLNPATFQKRLGDGYYEQQLINEQILQKTGKTTLGNYANNEAQYQALMDAGVTYAQQFQLVPGIALSAAQMAALTSDIVWLVAQNVTLQDGSVQSVLTPVVYLSSLRKNDLTPNGSLMLANDINLLMNGTLTNSGTLQANTNTIVNATGDINNSGTIQSNAQTGTTVLMAGNDLNSSGNLNGNRIAVLTGRDANFITSTTTATSKQGTQIGIDRISTVNAGQFSVQAGRDANFNAAQVTTTGDASVTAIRNANLSVVTTQSELNVTYDDQNHLYKKQTQANGTTITTGGNATLAAGNDLNSQAAYVNSAQALTAQAGHDINIGAATQTTDFDQATSRKDSGLLSSTRTTTQDQRHNTQAVGSTFSGNTVTVQAGHDFNLAGSNLVAQNQLSIRANNDINVTSTKNVDQSHYQETETKSGVFTGGNRLHVGQQITDIDTVQTSVTNNGSTIGSVNGSVALTAKRDANLTGIQLQAKQNIDVTGRNVNIAATVDTVDAQTTKTVTTSGLRIGAQSNISDAAMALRQSVNRGEEVNDPRLKALYAAKAAYAARDLSKLAEAAQQNKQGSVSGKATIGLGVTVEQRVSTSHVDIVNKAQAAAGGNVNITAKGDSTPDQGDINLKGVGLKGNNVALDAKRDINASSQAATSSNEDSYKRLNAEAGLFASGQMGGGKSSGGFGVYGAADYQQSSTELSSTTHTETTIDAASKLTTNSGRDTTLKGVLATADTIDTTVGRNLTMTSEQDTDTYRQKQLGGSLEGRYAFGNSGFSGTLNYAQTKSDYASVQEQTSLNAGQGGYNVNVGGHTQLNGAKIDSQATPDKNKLTTNTLGATDIKNEASYSAVSANISFGTDGGGGAMPSLNPLAALPGLTAPTSDKKDNTTKSAIAPGSIIVKQDQQTGQDSTQGISRDTANANKPLDRIFDANKVAEQQELGKVLGEVGNRAIGDLSQKLGLKDGSPEKMALHAALAALQAGAAGGNALAGAAATAGTEWIGTQVADYLSQNSSLSSSQKKAIQQWAALVTGAAIGGVVGGNSNAALAGGATSLDAERYNRQIHEDGKAKEKTLAKQLADQSNGKYTQAQIEDALRSANNNKLGETASTGAVVPYDAKAPFNIYDATGMVLGRASDGTYVLMQNPAMLTTPSTDLQTYIKNSTGNTYSWNNTAPQISAIPLSALPSILNGTVTPEMLASRRDNAADAASWVSTQSGRFSSAATAYGTYLASQPNAVSQAGAAIQFGMAGTATVVGFVTSALEQLLRPNVGQTWVSGGVDIFTGSLGNKFPLLSPALTEFGEVVKDSTPAINLQNAINRKGKK